ncbi:hypothetical protein [Flectobacillus longus]|uniref:hypothetical protein n=1 Tax=Flectobacillus longus TaxID=2984207 RepID=UPI0024B7F963|nr:hypothetical protein [Flectobacillus longus]MDI9878294.1 hypothetical protein [Flectobacillus longus]
MKKLVVLLFMFIAAFITSNAQAQAFQNGDKLLNLGLGLNSYYSGGVPFGASFEVGIDDDLSVGANVDYLSNSNYGYRFTALYFGGRGSYHFNRVLNIKDEKFDLYAGADLGYRSFSWADSYSGLSIDSYGSGIYLGVHLGAKYYFSDKVGAFAELGAVGSTNARIGVGFKLK